MYFGTFMNYKISVSTFLIIVVINVSTGKQTDKQDLELIILQGRKYTCIRIQRPCHFLFSV